MAGAQIPQWSNYFLDNQPKFPESSLITLYDKINPTRSTENDEFLLVKIDHDARLQKLAIAYNQIIVAYFQILLSNIDLVYLHSNIPPYPEGEIKQEFALLENVAKEYGLLSINHHLQPKYEYLLVSNIFFFTYF